MHHKDNVAYVASTLPVSVLDQRLNEWKIARILVASRQLEISYRYLKEKHPQIEILVVPRHPFLQLLTLFFHLLSSRINSCKVYFFHECCCFLFDISIGLIRPKGVFHPIVTLNSFQRIELRETPQGLKKIIISLLGLSKQFTPYLRDGENGGAAEILWARTGYPHCITKSVSLPRLQTDRKICALSSRKKLDVLILLGSDIVSSRVLRAFYQRLLNSFCETDACFYGKDHPNPGSRLNFMDKRVKMIDPYCPIEFVEDNFDFVIGVASTALAHFPGRAITVLSLLGNENPQAVVRRLEHLRDILSQGELFVPLTFEELIDYLNFQRER